MTEYSKYNFVYRMQKWMDSVPGQTFLNYAYSWGAAVVILGTLFKLTHLPGANLMLFLGMGTEVVVFFLSAFDRPFDKTSIGRELATSSSVKQEMEEELTEKPEMKQTPVGGYAARGTCRFRCDGIGWRMDCRPAADDTGNGSGNRQLRGGTQETHGNAHESE